MRASASPSSQRQCVYRALVALLAILALHAVLSAPAHAQDAAATGGAPAPGPAREAAVAATPAAGNHTGPQGAGEAAPAQNGSPEAGKTPAKQSAPGGWSVSEHRNTLVGFAVGLAGFLAGAAVLLFFAGRKPQAPYISKLNASFFFWLGMTYVILLLGLAILYNILWQSRAPYLFGQILPIAVPWFGAIGAVTISLEGVFYYSQRSWNADFNYWHLGRPVFGAVLGIVAFFLFVLIISSAGTPPTFLQKVCTPDEEACVAPKNFIVYYVIAFLVGYREETFRELIRRATDLLLKPDKSAAQPPALTFTQNGQTIRKLEFPATPSGTAAHLTVQVENTGDGALSAPAVTITPAQGTAQGVFTVNDPFTPGASLASRQKVNLDVTFTPSAAGAASATLSVAGKELRPVLLMLSGTGS